MIRTKGIMTEIYNSNKVGRQLTDEELKKLQNHLLKMYRDVEAVCIKHDLDICLAYGNVLGAVRHGGWIPWDDDLDTHMPRKDYELFLTKYANELPPQYKVSSYHSKDGSIARFAKVIDTSTTFVPVGGQKNEYSGVFIDIFPIDNISTNTFINKIKKCWAYFLMYVAGSVMQVEQDSKTYKDLMFSTKAGKCNWKLRQTLGWIFSFASSKKWHGWIERFAIHPKTTGYSHVLSDLDLSFKRIPNDLFFPYTTVDVGGYGEINLPHKYKDYLTRIYGDWEKIPEDNDKWHHYVKEFNIPD